MNIKAIINRGNCIFFFHHCGVVKVGVLERKNIHFYHDHGVVEVVENVFNVFLMQLMNFL